MNPAKKWLAPVLILLLILTVITVLVPFGAASDSAKTVEVTSVLSTRAVSPSGTVTQTIGLANYQGVEGGITSFALGANYDPDKFTVSNISMSTGIIKNEKAGRVTFLYANAAQALAAGTVIEITYTAKEAAGSAIFTVDATRADYFTDTAAPPISNQVVPSYAEASTVNFTNVAIEYETDGSMIIVPKDGAALAAFEAKITGQNLTLVIKDKNGTAIPAAPRVGTGMTVEILQNSNLAATYTIVVMADTDGDGLAAVSDLVQMKKHQVGGTALSAVQLKAADLDDDGAVNAEDLVILKKILLGLA